MKKQICSNAHFKRLLKTFKKITLRVSEDYKNYNISASFEYFLHSNLDYFSFEKSLEKLYKNYKANPFKTKSGITSIRYDSGIRTGISKFFVTYTFEDEFGKRSLNTKNIIFRVYIKEEYRKKRLVKWVVPVNWEYLN